MPATIPSYYRVLLPITITFSSSSCFLLAFPAYLVVWDATQAMNTAWNGGTLREGAARGQGPGFDDPNTHCGAETDLSPTFFDTKFQRQGNFREHGSMEATLMVQAGFVERQCVAQDGRRYA